MNYFLVVNTSSNSGKSRKVIQGNRDLIKSYLPNSEIRYVEEGESIRDVISGIYGRFDVIVACGGDGTINSVASSIKDRDIILGILPIGTGNDFSKTLGLGKSLEENLSVLKGGKLRSVDLVQVNDSFFINTLGIGFDGETNYIAAILPGWLSKLRYLLAGLRVLKTARNFEAVIDTHASSDRLDIETKMIVAANGKWEGGKYLISPNSDISDGLIELRYTQKTSTFRLVLEFLKLSLGFQISKGLFGTITGHEFLIETSEPVYVHKDGEILERNKRFHLKVFPKKIKVIT